MTKQSKVTYATELNEQQTAFRDELDALNTAISQAKAAVKAKLRKCPHLMAYEYREVRYSKQPGAHVYKEGSTWCQLCERHFGHYCPDSPDHVCYYFSNRGDPPTVKLFTGETVPVPGATQDEAEYETQDCCLFCGMPQERK